jgi:radical SAM protein (TIGR01212 family)
LFLAYFQPATNTYAEVDSLRHLFSQAISFPSVVGISVGTRPDCVADEVLDLMEELAQRTYVSLELGIQSIHARSLAWMNRCHGYEVAVDAVQRSLGRGFDVGAHVVLGIPGESVEDMLQTAREMGRLNLDSIKFHNLYAVRQTRLAQQVVRGEVALMGRVEYLRILVDCLELLPPTMVIERICGDAPRQYLVEPAWCLDKPGTLAALQAELSRRDTWQGKRYKRSC